MIFLFTHPNCPSCGSTGTVVNREHDVRKCVSCETLYGEFGIVSEGVEKEKEPS